MEREFTLVQEFSFDVQRQLVRSMLDRDGEPWFVANDVCDVLEISNPRHAVSKLDDDEKGVAFGDTLGGKQEVNIINESGLYNLIFRSNKPQAKVFRKFVTSEVLPTIRKQGFFGTMRRMEIPEDLEQACAFFSYLRKQETYHMTMVKDIREMKKGCINRISAVAPPFVMPADPQMGLPLTQKVDEVTVGYSIGKDEVGKSDLISGVE
jgi:prophage antirepressor-like protein